MQEKGYVKAAQSQLPALTNSKANFLHFQLARCYALLGNTQLALKNLERLFQLDAEFGRVAVRESSDFDRLRNIPRFQALMQTN